MRTFLDSIQELSIEDRQLVDNFIKDLAISYDPEWVMLTEEEKRELESIEKEDTFIDFDLAMRALGI